MSRKSPEIMDWEVAQRIHHQAAPGRRAGQKPEAIVVTAWQRGDSQQFEPSW
ncbi:hypothetical protein AB0O06_25245 [Streptomyces tauricus]